MSDSETNSPNASIPHIFLAPNRTGWSGDQPFNWPGRALLGRLALFFRLPVYGTNGMLLNTCYAMEAGAIVLAIIYTFDFVMWSMLLNLILQKGEFSISLLTPVALLLAFMMSTMTVVMESNIFTTDFSSMSLKLISTILARLFIVFFFAYLTAQPLHILLFDGPIRERSRDEQAIAMAVQLSQKIVELEQRKGNIDNIKTSVDDVIVGLQEQIEKEISNKNTKYGEKSSEETTLKRAQSDKAYASRQIKYFQGLLSDPLRSARASQNIQTWKSKQAEASILENSTSQTISRLEGEIQSAEKQIDNLQSQLNEHLTMRGQKKTELLQTFESRQDAARAFVANILASEPDETRPLILPEGVLANPFVYRDYHFFERRRVLNDLCDGERPRWPLGEPTTAETVVLGQVLKLSRSAPELGTLERQKWDDDTLRLVKQGKNLWYLHVGITAIGMFVPIMALILKLISPSHLKNYYSEAWQREQLHPEALLSDRVS